MTTQTTIEAKIAADLLNIGAVALRPDEPFTWTSGIKSPIYCDNRLTMAYPEVRDRIAEGFAELIRTRYPDAEVIAGTATAGIPHAAWVAQKLNLPMAYIRDKAKGHGKQNQIEGLIKEGQKVVVIEDLISTGGSSLKAALAVREAGAEPLAVLAIFSYQLDRAIQVFAEADVPLATLSNYTALMQTALELGTIQESQVELLKSWREDPSAFGK
ncbi:orotate phosphoribosyltransferase [Saccharibacillus endophyticus]|uniref:Orotate phosphoribosyltransferase n=1 Tax=Saccharibacillus endophyticus TaxID=2060666 RepID=A0ABQ1ZQ50_9BACL|nr:orotate phosphoribosyltransferase [Saccharibacillus endophyticus]GGH73931.1 orotate phosphoribosyltransferase [Saccharibacillus endophyticus]